MLSSVQNYRASLIIKQLEYRYRTYKENRAVENAFAYGFQPTPLARTVAISKEHPLLLALIATGFILSFMVLVKPSNTSNMVQQSMEIDRKIEERLASLAPDVSPPVVLKSPAPIKPLEIKISPLPVTPVPVSRKTFMQSVRPYTLLVNKRTKTLYVTEEQGDSYSIVQEFPISFGEVSGNKQFEGDKKTPEGAYTLIDLKIDEELPAMYGPYAAVLNYPNKRDKAQGKTGSGIWIHGTGKNQLTPDTQGCVELSDPHLIQLFSFISNGTKIIIVPEDIDITPTTNFVQKSLLNGVIAS